MKCSVINNFYTTDRAEDHAKYILQNATNGNGNIEDCHVYAHGNVCPQGYGIRPALIPYLFDEPFKSSGITPMAVNQIDISKMGVRN